MEKTVKQNVLLGFHSKRSYGFFNELFNTSSFRRKRKKMEREADKILEFLNILGMKDQLAKNLADTVRNTVN